MSTFFPLSIAPFLPFAIRHSSFAESLGMCACNSAIDFLGIKDATTLTVLKVSAHIDLTAPTTLVGESEGAPGLPTERDSM